MKILSFKHYLHYDKIKLLNKIKAVIFDLDGIIIDSEPWQRKAFDKTIKPFNIKFTKKEFLKLVGIKTIDNFKTIVKKYKLNISAEKLTEIKGQIYTKILTQSIKPRKGLLKILAYLEPKYIIAVASNSTKHDVLLPLNLLKITKQFKLIKTGDDVKKGKPSPEIFLKTAKKLKVKPEECAAIEDSMSGINAAKKAGMLAIAVPTEYTKMHEFNKADYILKNLKGIRRIL